MSGTTTPPVDHLRQAILVRVPNITRDVVDLELRSVASEFFTRTLSWRQQYTFCPQIGCAAYIIPVEQPGMNIAAILSADYAGRAMRVGDLSGHFTEVGSPSVIALRDARTVVLHPAPSTLDHVVRFTAAMTVDILDADPAGLVLPYAVVPYTGTIMEGVLSRLYAMPEKPWTSKTLMEYHERRFRRGMAEVRLASNAGRVRGAQSWRFPRFA